jgi:hypothetical protein
MAEGPRDGCGIPIGITAFARVARSARAAAAGAMALVRGARAEYAPVGM